MHTEIMLAAHIAMHHKLHRQRGLLTGIEDHRTDGRCRRSTSLHDFDVRLPLEGQWLIANIGDLKFDLDRLP